LSGRADLDRRPLRLISLAELSRTFVLVILRTSTQEADNNPDDDDDHDKGQFAVDAFQ
jgi:hypothetical protein